MELLIGSKKKKLISTAVLLIIAFLLQIRGKKSETETIKLKPEKQKVRLLIIKAGKGNVDSVFFMRIKKLVAIVIPTWKCQ